MKKAIFLEINGEAIPLNPFVQKIFTNIIKGMVSSLDNIPEHPETITLSVKNQSADLN